MNETLSTTGICVKLFSNFFQTGRLKTRRHHGGTHPTWAMDPRKQPGWQRLAQPGESLGSYADGTPVWVYRGAGWSKGYVQSLTSKGGKHAVDRLVVRLADERGGHPYVVVYDTRNICRRSA